MSLKGTMWEKEQMLYINLQAPYKCPKNYLVCQHDFLITQYTAFYGILLGLSPLNVLNLKHDTR